MSFYRSGNLALPATLNGGRFINYRQVDWEHKNEIRHLLRRLKNTKGTLANLHLNSHPKKTRHHRKKHHHQHRNNHTYKYTVPHVPSRKGDIGRDTANSASRKAKHLEQIRTKRLEEEHRYRLITAKVQHSNTDRSNTSTMVSKPKRGNSKGKKSKMKSLRKEFTMQQKKKDRKKKKKKKKVVAPPNVTTSETNPTGTKSTVLKEDEKKKNVLDNSDTTGKHDETNKPSDNPEKSTTSTTEDGSKDTTPPTLEQNETIVAEQAAPDLSIGGEVIAIENDKAIKNDNANELVVQPVVPGLVKKADDLRLAEEPAAENEEQDNTTKKKEYPVDTQT